MFISMVPKMAVKFFLSDHQKGERRTIVGLPQIFLDCVLKTEWKILRCYKSSRCIKMLWGMV